MVRSITIINTTRSIIFVAVFIRTITRVMVMVICIAVRYIIVVRTSRSTVRVFTKAIIVIIRIITSNIVMMI